MSTHLSQSTSCSTSVSRITDPLPMQTIANTTITVEPIAIFWKFGENNREKTFDNPAAAVWQHNFGDSSRTNWFFHRIQSTFILKCDADTFLSSFLSSAGINWFELDSIVGIMWRTVSCRNCSSKFVIIRVLRELIRDNTPFSLASHLSHLLPETKY